MTEGDFTSRRTQEVTHAAPEAPKSKGHIKFFNHGKGFGFIAPDGGGKDIFVSINEFQSAGIPKDYIQDGARIEYDVDYDPRGTKAVNLRIPPKEVSSAQ